MRSFLFIILLSIACSCSQKNNDDIVVDFKVENMTYSKVAIVVSPEMIKEMELDKHGKDTCDIRPSVLWRGSQECFFPERRSCNDFF